MMQVLRVDRDVAGTAAGRRPWGQCEAPLAHLRDARGRITTYFCNGVVVDAAQIRGTADSYTRYLCREHGDEYAGEVQPWKG